MGDWRDSRNFGYDQWRDQMSDWLNERSYNDSRSDLEYDRQWEAALNAAKYGDYSKLKELGINPNIVTGGGGYGYGGGGSGNDTRDTGSNSTSMLSGDQWDNLFNSVHRDDPNETRSAARTALNQYWDYLNDYQKTTLAHLAGMDADALANAGGVNGFGVDQITDLTNLLYPGDQQSQGTQNPTGNNAGRSGLGQQAQHVYDTAMNEILLRGNSDDALTYVLGEIDKGNVPPEDVDALLRMFGY